MNHSIESILESRWQELNRRSDPEILWISFRSTPPFPSLWPPAEGIQLISYVYSYGNYSDVYQSIVDGEFISAPWACIRDELRPSPAQSVEWLEDELHPIGIQGFRPLDKDELAFFEQAAHVEDAFERLLQSPEEATQVHQLLKNFYGMWIGLNGVIGGQIHESHAVFFEWLKKGQP